MDLQLVLRWRLQCFLQSQTKKCVPILLPIGGLKEKLLAAKNAGIRTVLVPKENKKDVDELSSEITKGLEIIPVSQMEEVLKIALVRTRRKNDGN